MKLAESPAAAPSGLLALQAKSARPWDIAIAGLGLALLYLPTYYDLARGPWTDPHEAHGPFMLAIAFGAMIARRQALFVARDTAPLAGLATVLFGLVIYVLGRSQEFLVLETMSQIPVFGGTIVALRGWHGLRQLWFPVVFLGFSIVWPGFVIDKLTLPLKQWATDLTVFGLREVGYPIAHTGVIIAIGKYQLLVADACSGLNSMISLMSVGVLYLYMIQRAGVVRNAVILLAMPLIAFGANVLRIVALSLITYHFGNAWGQGFLHEFTGLFLFGVSLVGVFLLDGMIEAFRRLLKLGVGRGG